MPEGEHEHTPETPQVITPVVETESKLTEPLIDHAGKIAHIEERQAQHEVELVRQLGDLEGRLQTATASQASAIEERIARIEARLEEMAAKPAETVEEELPGAVDFEVPPIEESPAKPEKMARGIRARRKAKREKK